MTTQSSFSSQLQVYQSYSSNIVQAQSSIVGGATFEETRTQLVQVRTYYETRSSTLSSNCGCTADTTQTAAYRETVVQATTAFQETVKYCSTKFTSQQYASLQSEFRGIWSGIERSAEYAATARIDVKAVFQSAHLDSSIFSSLGISLKGVLSGVLGAVNGVLGSVGSILGHLL
ncbi:hypothetical protein CROQUDRAFT_651586 [Cronartium quercuum f. sp. fusiforme G11]|uniref:Uncharacterized protein n=1 Tax=Cronartium quercuum f. sp. fusiforme G11 TaxID=708437 RepID=A0A9P6NX02_9BASI|nr:hypothetical protein CROQUDRAFT_651586 [Cronartium quercuum f. sp. fusiforme G11]